VTGRHPGGPNDLAAAGGRQGDRIALTVTRTGRETDQWRVFPFQR
jgi:hypothetical protein